MVDKKLILFVLLVLPLLFQTVEAAPVETLPPNFVTNDSAILEMDLASKPDPGAEAFFQYWEKDETKKVATVKRNLQGGVNSRKITGLEADTKYYYRPGVEVNGNTFWGNRSSFRTEGGSESFDSIDDFLGREFFSWEKPIPYYGINLTGKEFVITLGGIFGLLTILALFKLFFRVIF